MWFAKDEKKYYRFLHLTGGDEFQTGRSISGVTTECRLLWRTFPRFFRRQGVETDMMLRIVDTPPGVPDPLSIHQLCPEGMHVLGIVVRADLPHEGKHLQQHAEVLRSVTRISGPWAHGHLVLFLTALSASANCVCFLCLYFGLQKLLGPEWHQHSILILTHSDHLRETGLQPSAYLAQPFTGWLRNLAGEIRGGVWFLDNTSDWSSVRGRPLRDQILCLSAKNHHRALTIRTSVWHHVGPLFG